MNAARIILVSAVVVGVTTTGWTRLRPQSGASRRLDLITPSPAFLSGTLPYDVDEVHVQKLVHANRVVSAHRDFDNLAWKAFVALNWPADSNGEPSKTMTISNSSAPRVWEYWRPSQTIFLPGGQRPKRWDNAFIPVTNTYWKGAWRQNTTQASNLEAFSGPLVDQNGKWVRYQVRVNRSEFDYIYQNKLYSLDGQVHFSQGPGFKKVNLPSGDGHRLHGAIEVKFAWKELGKNDDPKRFFTRTINADLSEPFGANGKPLQRHFLAGLVGMHIAMRTPSSPEWIWSTFEQIDNVRVNKDKGGHSVHPNFFDPHQTLPVNVLADANAVQDNSGNLLPAPPGKANKWLESKTTTPVQVKRLDVPYQGLLNPLDNQLGAVTRGINLDIQKILGGPRYNSVFQYYELIDTQWPVHPGAPAFAGGYKSAPESIAKKTPGDMVPTFLVNTTMETYFQKGKQRAGNLEQDDRLNPAPAESIDPTMINGTESCVGCHYSAGIAIGFQRDQYTGKVLVNEYGVPTAIFGENNHFGNTGGANFSWMLQLEAQAQARGKHDPDVEWAVPATKSMKKTRVSKD